MERRRSGCPVNLTVELVGDSWTLLVLRDVMFADRHTFGELHAGSLEGIATNILADRLRRLVQAGLLTREPVPGHKQKVSYRLTEKALDLVPVLTSLAAFSLKHLDPDPALASWARELQDGGPEQEAELRAQLRATNGLAEASPTAVR